MNQPMDHKDYYRAVTSIDIGLVALEMLGDRITHKTGKILECDCPNHQSQSKRSLHIFLDRQGWYCHGCGVGGDVLHLVEFLLFGVVTTGQNGPMPDSHKEARDHLANLAGMPKLSEYGCSPEELAEIERERKTTTRCFNALTALAECYHQKLLENHELMAWFQDKYGIDKSMIQQLQIGYADNEGVVKTLRTQCAINDMLATGGFIKTRTGGVMPFFNGRITFPYWSRGHVVNMIGRQTPWTPKNDYEHAKYKKLLTHDPTKRPYVAGCINNSVLFNEDALLSQPERIIITEGVTDCISLMQHGFAAVSPVTVRIKKADWERLIPKLRHVPLVYICQDNEVSQVGLKASLDMAAAMEAERINTKLVELPLEKSQREARATLVKRFELDRLDGPGVNRIQAAIKEMPPEEAKAAEALLADSKIDVNAYFASGHGVADFERLLSSALSSLEFQIAKLPTTNVQEFDIPELLEPILEKIAKLQPMVVNQYLKAIQAQIGKKMLPMAVLRAQLRSISKALEEREKSERKKERRKATAKPGTCKAAMEEAIIAMEDAGEVDITKAANAAYDWFMSKGARFYFSTNHDPIMYFLGDTYWMDSSDKGERRRYHSMMYEHTELVTASSKGRIFFEVLVALAMKHGMRVPNFSWLHSVVESATVYFNLNNENHEIVKITPDGVEVMQNGGNPDGVILVGNNKMKPITFIPDADLERAEALTDELIFKNLTCAPRDRYFILAWMSCFMLIDFAGTRPMTRFEGSQGSGKTMASKLISTLLYGDPQQKLSTEAALYSDGTQNPMVLLDNIEIKNVTEGLISFMLTCITGIAKEKRSSGNDCGTVLERPNCLVNTTGIEPLGGELTEVLSRTFITMFDQSEGREVFLETEVLALIRKHRDYLMSALMKRTSHTLAMIADGNQTHVMKLIQERLGNHSKRRCNDYLSLMYLMTFAGEPPETVDQALSELAPEFAACVQKMNQASMDTAMAANPTATCLSVLFNVYRQALASDVENAGMSVRTFKATFHERYQIQFASETQIKDVTANVLFAALKRVAKEYDLNFPMTSVRQFGRRLNNDTEVIQNAGFTVTSTTGRARSRFYTVTVAQE